MAKHSTKRAEAPAGNLAEFPGLRKIDEFRLALYTAMTACSDALLSMVDGLLSLEARLPSLAYLSLAGPVDRSHDMRYKALTDGRIAPSAFRAALLAQPIPKIKGRIVLAVDGTGWPRPDANASDRRVFLAKRGRSAGVIDAVPGWAYSFLVALSAGASSWVTPLDAELIGPGESETEVAVRQLRRTVTALIGLGHWRQGDPLVLVVADAGYAGPRLAYALEGLPVQVVVRCRSNRVWYRSPGQRSGPGRRAVHGSRFVCADADTWGRASLRRERDSERYGRLTCRCWNRLHQQLTRQSQGWATHTGPLPVLARTLIRLTVTRLPGGRKPEAVWLWTNQTGLDDTGLDSAVLCWLRRFDIEHFFRFLKQDLSWMAPKVRAAHAGTKWTMIVIAAYVHVSLAREAACDLRLPWERRYEPDQLPPRRVLRAFRHLQGHLSLHARVAKSNRPGTGRATGSSNRHRASIKPPGKPVKPG